MIAELENLQTAISALGYDCSLSFGNPIATDLTKSGTGRVVLFFPTLNTESEQMMWQGSPLVNISGSITAYATTDKSSVALLHSVLRDIGFRRENGDVGRPPRLPIEISLPPIKVLYINCPGGVRCVAEQSGEFWATEQNIELSYYRP